MGIADEIFLIEWQVFLTGIASIGFYGGKEVVAVAERIQ